MYGQTDVPTGLSNVVALSGEDHSLALKSDGTVVAWGRNKDGQADVPAGLSNVVAISAGGYHSLALRSKGTQLPDGLTCSTEGIVSGVPAVAGKRSVTFVVRDQAGEEAIKSVEILISDLPKVLTDVPTVLIPEGGSSTFQIRLSAQPAQDAVVNVARTSGDSDISVSGVATLTFTTLNWADYQTVSVSAAEDDGDNLNSSATIGCTGSGLIAGSVDAVEVDDDYRLTVSSPYGEVACSPNASCYVNGTVIILTVSPDSDYAFKNWSGDLVGTNNPVSLTMNGNKTVTAHYEPLAPEVLPPGFIGKTAFKARWNWVEGGAPEGQLSVALDADFTRSAPGYEARYVMNDSECMVTNLDRTQDYWYRVRRLLPNGSASLWSEHMKVHTGRNMPVFPDLLSEVPVSKGVCQQFALSNLVSNKGTLKVKSTNPEAVKAALSGEALTLNYLWKGTNCEATITMSLSNSTGYAVSYETTLNRAGGKVAYIGRTGLTNVNGFVVQDVTFENQTGETIFGVRIVPKGLDQPTWLVNQTGLDPKSKKPILEIPCVIPANSQVVVRVRYNKIYMKQARTRPVVYEAFAIMPFLTKALSSKGQIMIPHQDLYDGRGFLGLRAIPNHLYTISYSDNNGATWTPDDHGIRTMATSLMWLDGDLDAPANRIYRVTDSGR
jgi:hypothetical protein